MNKKHGMYKSGEYKAWRSMLSRCLNSRDIGYSRYGGRGITVCEHWLKFDDFLADMGQKPSAAHSLDRKEANGNYEPGNCRWATPLEQARNRSSNALIEYQGKAYCRVELAAMFGINPCTLRDRLKKGWPLQEALSAEANVSASLRASWAQGRFVR